MNYFCRSVFVHYHEEAEIKGIKVYRFKMPDAKMIFAHKDFCFCPKGKNNECFKYGVLSMAPCRDSTYFALFAYYFEDFQVCVILLNLSILGNRCSHCFVRGSFLGFV